MPRPKLDRTITSESFEQLLAWLDGDREVAGRRYEVIRAALIKIFTYRGCREAEDLADETIDKVIRKVPDLVVTYVGDPTLYFFGVANRVQLDYLARQRTAAGPSALNTRATAETARDDQDDAEYACLERCMTRLPQDARTLLLQYYDHECRAKIDGRQQLAQRLGVNLNTLRVRIHRLKSEVERCVRACVANTGHRESNSRNFP